MDEPIQNPPKPRKESPLLRVLLVGDNRHNVNWGGRGASTALSLALRQRFSLLSSVSGADFRIESSGFGFVRTLLPASRSAWFHHACANAERRRIYRWYVNLEKKLGARDFVGNDPVETATIILAERHRHPYLARLCEAVETADAVVINGEGDFVFTTPARREALFMLGMVELAVRCGTPVAFVNALISDCPHTGRNMQTLQATYDGLRKCFAVCVRDCESLRYLEVQMPGIRAQLVPDSLFTWYPRMVHSREQLPSDGDFTLPHPERDNLFGTLRFDQHYVCVGGSASAALDHPRAILTYTALVQKLVAAGLRPILIEADGRDSFLEEVAAHTGAPMVTARTPILLAGAILANARLLISGRYHATILAALGGTPALLLQTAAHKMQSLGALLGLPPSVCYPTLPDKAQLNELVQQAHNFVCAGDALRSRISRSAAELCSAAQRLPAILHERLLARSPQRTRYSPKQRP